jgi:hypothetical protein
MLIRRSGGAWGEPDVPTFINEGVLQQMLAESPALLNLKEPVVVVRELWVPEVGKVDLAAVGLSGRITLVECKLANNSEIRRSVVGQAFAYAAGLWRRSYDEFDSLFTARHGRNLAAAVEDLAGIQDDWDEDVFRQNVAENLELGRFDFVIAVDTITDELKLVVSYLNEHTPEIAVLALELDYQAAGDVEIVVPKFYGEESVARKTQPSARRVWDEESLFNTLAEQCPEGVPVIRRLYEDAVDRGGNFSWGGGASPSVTVTLPVGTIRATVWRCRTRPPARWVVMFDGMQRRGVAPELMRRFANRLRGIPGVAAQFEGVEEAEWRRRAFIPVAILAAPEVADTVVSALADFLDIQG